MKTMCIAAAAALIFGSNMQAQTEGDPPPSKWSYSQKVSKIDDTTSRVAMLEAEDTVFRTYDRGKPKLVVRFKDDRLEVYVILGVFVTEKTPVRLRKNRNPPVRQDWDASKDGDTIFSPTPEEFAATLLETDRLVMEVEPYRESPVIFEFDTRGFKASAQQLINAFAITRKVQPAREPRTVAAKPAATPQKATPRPTPSAAEIAAEIQRRYAPR